MYTSSASLSPLMLLTRGLFGGALQHALLQIKNALPDVVSSLVCGPIAFKGQARTPSYTRLGIRYLEVLFLKMIIIDTRSEKNDERSYSLQ
jgi:hypothetical protein